MAKYPFTEGIKHTQYTAVGRIFSNFKRHKNGSTE